MLSLSARRYADQAVYSLSTRSLDPAWTPQTHPNLSRYVSVPSLFLLLVHLLLLLVVLLPVVLFGLSDTPTLPMEIADGIGQPPRYTYPEHPPPPLPGTKPKLKSNTTSRGPQIVTAANYGPVRGSAMPGLISGTGGKETLGELGLVPQSVVMIKWEEEGMNGQSLLLTNPIIDWDLI